MNLLEFRNLIEDPIAFYSLCWPEAKLYDKQQEIIESVRDNDETIVVAGNQLGKDYITGFIALWFFISRSPCHIITSSAGQTQLKSVLWGEMRNFILSSAIPLPLKTNDLALGYVLPDGSIEPKSYVLGIVTNTPENMQGHHLARGPDNQPRTLAIFDEASGIDDPYYNASDTWAHRKLIIGNPLPCNNFFYNGVKGGDIPREYGGGYHRKIIKVKASDSPNVRLALKEIEAGRKPSRKIIIPGVVSWDDYSKRRKLWDPIKQSIGLDAEFYEGSEVLMFPPDWLNRAEELARNLPSNKERQAVSMGLDCAEGGDSTVWTIVDHLGIIKQISIKTSDTSDIPGRTIALINEYDLDPANVFVDIGGGGKQHADNLKSKGYPVTTIAFGSSPTPVTIPPNKWAKREASEEAKENRSVYKNKRAEMYGILRDLLDPETEGSGFAIPDKLTELRRQLAPLPLLYDGEGRLFLPPKDKPSSTYTGETIRSILGCSPDEADSLVLATYGLKYPNRKIKVGALF